MVVQLLTNIERITTLKKVELQVPLEPVLFARLIIFYKMS
jgi:hypothetical protein